MVDSLSTQPELIDEYSFSQPAAGTSPTSIGKDFAVNDPNYNVPPVDLNQVENAGFSVSAADIHMDDGPEACSPVAELFGRACDTLSESVLESSPNRPQLDPAAPAPAAPQNIPSYGGMN